MSDKYLHFAEGPRRSIRKIWRGRPDRLIAVCLAAGLAFLTMAWVFGNPPGAAPDEPAALVKALATGHLELSGKPYTARLPPYTLNAAARKWISQSSRSYSLPARQTPSSLAVCMAFKPDRTAACLDDAPARTGTEAVTAVTPDGVYPPFVFFPLGLAARLATTPNRAFYFARVVSAGLSLLFLAAATWCAVVRRRTFWSATGLLLAATPMVMFLTSTVSSEGVEIAAAICFWSGLLRAQAEDSPKFAWIAIGAGGAAMALSRQLDVVWLVAGAVLFVSLLGPRLAYQRIRAGGRYSVVALGVAGIGGVTGLAWDVLASPVPKASVGADLRHRLSFEQVTVLAHQAIGKFGWLDTVLPNPAERTWLVVIAAVACLALVVGTWRQRLVLVGTLISVAIATEVVEIFVISPTGYPMQTRYILAIAVVFPLVSAEIVAGRDGGQSLVRIRPVVLFGVVAMVAIVQWVAYYTNARRYGVGVTSSRSLLTQAAWQPPGGTLLWLVVCAVGVSSLAAAAILTAIHSRSFVPRPPVETGELPA